ncbi:MAG: hypothetical protein M0P74_00740 [Syntrophales bacterium]|jgi:nucleoside phosphorylase|nr:hypothetical protein [Syntrophales bacterium]
MQSHPEISEPYTVACDVLIDVFDRLNVLPLTSNDRDAFRRYARADLATKSERAHPDFQRSIWQKAFDAQLPDLVRRHLGTTSFPEPDSTHIHQSTRYGHVGKSATTYEKIVADIFIVTVIQEEFEAVLNAFGIDSSAAATHTIRGGKFYTTRLQRQAGDELVVYITMIGEARNVPCVNVCRDIFERFSVGVCILVGIAGGNHQAKVKLGDVVASLQIFDLEGGKSERYFWNLLQRVQPRLEGYDPPTDIKRNIQNLNPTKHQWQQRFEECMGHYREKLFPKPINENAWKAKPTFHRGIIVVGEKVLADGSLPKTAKRLSDQVYAVEMEGSGFASACKHCGIPWLDIRGISDFANPVKEDGWHIPASAAAATLTRIFLEKEYRTKTDELEY